MTITRRALIGGGAALAGAGAVAHLGGHQPAAGAATATAVADFSSADDIEALDVPVMLSVTDAQAGELEILVGEQAVAFTDRGLVSRLIRAARNEAS